MAIMESGETIPGGVGGTDKLDSDVYDFAQKIESFKHTIGPNSRLTQSFAMKERFLFALQRLSAREGKDIHAEADDYVMALKIATDASDLQQPVL